MNKTRLVLPLAALLMAPVMSSCGPDRYQAIFNNDQTICAHGTQYIDVTLDRYVKGKLTFSKDIKPSDFVMPKKYKDYKEVKYVYAYSSDSLILSVGDKDGTEGIPTLKESETIEITVKESAFSNPNLGGAISVSLFNNEIRFADASSESIGATSYEGVNKVELIGANFVDDLCNKVILLTGGKPDDTALQSLFEVSNVTGTGAFGFYETDKGSYIYLDVDFAEGKKAKDITITFKDGSTDLDGYKCDYRPIGLGGSINNYFVKA